MGVIIEPDQTPTAPPGGAERPRGLRPDAIPAARPGPRGPEDTLENVPEPTLLDRIPTLLANAGKPFRRDEIVEIKRDLRDTFADYCELIDLAVEKTNKNHTECTIWRSLDDEDLGTLADAWVLAGQSRPRVNIAVRHMIATRVYLKAGYITLDSALQTLDFYRQEGGFVLWFPQAFPLPWNTSKSA